MNDNNPSESMPKDNGPSTEAPDSSRDGETTNGAAELEKVKKDYLYLMADFDNYRKNAIKERSELIKYGAERFIRELLTVVDNFDRALGGDLTEKNMETFREGVQMISQEMKSLLQRFGVQEVPAQGAAFDPNQHEALSSEPTDEVPPGHVTQVLQKAYKMHDKVLRPARVVVATEAKKE